MRSILAALLVVFCWSATNYAVAQDVRREARINELEKRIKELEDQLAQLERQTAHLKQELIGRASSDHAGYAKRIAELEQHNQQLVEAANKYALRIQELENEFTRISKLLCKSGDDPTSGS